MFANKRKPETYSSLNYDSTFKSSTRSNVFMKHTKASIGSESKFSISDAFKTECKIKVQGKNHNRKIQNPFYSSFDSLLYTKDNSCFSNISPQQNQVDASQKPQQKYFSKSHLQLKILKDRPSKNSYLLQNTLDKNVASKQNSRKIASQFSMIDSLRQNISFDPRSKNDVFAKNVYQLTNSNSFLKNRVQTSQNHQIADKIYQYSNSNRLNYNYYSDKNQGQSRNNILQKTVNSYLNYQKDNQKKYQTVNQIYDYSQNNLFNQENSSRKRNQQISMKIYQHANNSKKQKMQQQIFHKIYEYANENSFGMHKQMNIINEQLSNNYFKKNNQINEDKQISLTKSQTIPFNLNNKLLQKQQQKTYQSAVSVIKKLQPQPNFLFRGKSFQLIKHNIGL